MDDAPEWQGWFAVLREAAEVAGCTETEKRVLNLACRGFGTYRISRILGMRRCLPARHLHNCAEKLERAFPRVGAERGRDWVYALLECVRNVGLGGEPARAIYDLNGRQVCARARPFGTVAEDLLGGDSTEYALIAFLRQAR